MPWFRIDDGFWSHPKTLQLSDGAQALWMRAGSWSMHHLTDGLIPAFALQLLGAKPRFVNELVAVSLWIPDEGAYRFHDWSRYQPTRSQVEADRDAAAERKRRSREKSRRDKGVTDGAGSGDAAPSPSQPIPSHPTPPNGGEKTVPRKRGTRLERTWTPAPETVAQMREQTPGVDLRREHEVFVDYWTSKTGQAATKADWDATWRNWMRRKADDLAKQQPRSTAAQRNLSVVERFAAREQQEQHQSALEGM